MVNLTQLRLIAETRVETLNLQYQDDTVASSGLPVGLIVGAAVVLIVGLVIAKLISKTPSASNTPVGLLQEVCKAHEINGAGRTLLHKIATSAKIAQPAAMLLSAELFDSTVAHASSGKPLSRRESATLAELRSRLFAR